MSRLNIDRQLELEPKRIESSKDKLIALGYKILTDDGTMLQFMHKGKVVSFWPYSGWHSGKTIKDGRGFGKLLNQLERQK